MEMKEFIDKYCPELRTLSKKMEKTSPLEELPNDGIMIDDSGERIPYVLCEGNEIPIMDIITMSEDDFARQYPSMEARELYKNYIDSLVIYDGPEAISHIRNSLVQEQKRVKAFSESNSLSDSLW